MCGAPRPLAEGGLHCSRRHDEVPSNRPCSRRPGGERRPATPSRFPVGDDHGVVSSLPDCDETLAGRSPSAMAPIAITFGPATSSGLTVVTCDVCQPFV